ncbi:PriCT-2 domain-containing protein, partial [Crocosphaera watsonii]|uniref:PriCT-2 domain-containing protein n=1 Tax=Crocosphaera watsonii TaxID=263511 RepID=UPI0030DDC03E
QAKIEWEAKEKRHQETLARFNEQNLDEVKTLALEALNFIPPRQPGTETYEESLRVLMALTTIFGPTEAIAIAETWSPPMKGWNPARKIQGFRVGEVTAGSLFWIAQQHGFKFPERQRHSQGCSPIEPDADLYQAYVEWEIEQEKNEQAQETSEFIVF